jgi:uncharacterized protein (TIGR02679 family)
MRELPPGLVEWARMSGPASVLEAIRARARQGFRTESGTLRLPLTRQQRREIARLVGTAWDVSGRPLRLEYLTAALAEHDLTVRGFVEALDGKPLIDQRRKRAAEQAAAADERSEARSLLTAAGVPEACAEAWLTDTGLPRPGSGALASLAEQVAQVWRQLPGATGSSVRLGGLAASSQRDAHGLDYGEPLGRVLARLIALAYGLPRPRRAGRDWRRAWAAAGVRCDDVSSRVLVLDLPLDGPAPAARLCAATPGEPVWLSLRALDGEWSAPTGTQVFVCENPTIVEAAADELGSCCPPVVCTDGIPTTAALDLLAGLSAKGLSMRVRADVDDAGLVVVEQVLAVANEATLWRYDTATYAAHLGLPDQGASADGDTGSQLARLRDLYRVHSTPLHEEVLLNQLLQDLTASNSPTSS